MTTEITKSNVETPELAQQRKWQTPLFDIFENKDELLLVADMPGVNSDNIKIHLDKNELIIEGNRKASTHSNALAVERSACDYQRAFTIPPGVDEMKIKAENKHGVLRLHLPKSETVKPRQIQVKAG